MALVTYRKCDQCNKERLPHLSMSWFRLRANDAGFADDGFDFCSYACLNAWVVVRHLPRYCVTETRGIHANTQSFEKVS
jgi:hypothetical protein